MEETFRGGLQRSPVEFLSLVENHQSRLDKSALKTVICSLTANSPFKSTLCDALSSATARAIFAFQNSSNPHTGGGGIDDEDAGEVVRSPLPQKKRRRRSARNQRSPLPEKQQASAVAEQRRGKILNALRGYAHLALLCLAHPDKVFSPSDLFPTVQTLHDKLVLFEGDGALQDVVSTICEQWWRDSLPGKESLIAQSLPCLLSKSLSIGRKVDVHRVYSLREALTFLDFTDESIEDLKHLLIRCLVTPSYLRTDEGCRFLAFLFGLNVQLVKELIAIIRSQIPFGRSSILEAYGEVLYKAWRVAKGPSLQEIEKGCVQGLVEGAVYANSKSMSASIRKVLGGFIGQRTQEGVEALLFRLQEPILFRSLQVANSNVRRNALLLLVDMFPLEDPDASKEEKEALLEKQFVLLEKLLVDDCPDVRTVAVEGLCRILRLFWEVVPSMITVKLLTKIVDEMTQDTFSSAVRCAVVDGMIYLLDNPQSHELLKVLLPRLAPMLDDPVLAVRTSVADLLLTLKDIRALQFHKVISLESILTSLAGDQIFVAQRLTRLLIPSYFPSKVSIPEACNRFITLVKRSPSAAVKFCEYASSEGVPTKSLIELVNFLISLLIKPVDIDSQGREGILLSVAKLASSLGSNQSCKIALRELFPTDKFKCMLSSASTPSEFAAILHIASIIPPKDISELVKHCGQLIVDCKAVLQDETKQEEVRLAHKLIQAWGGLDDLMETLSKLLKSAVCIAGSGNVESEISRPKEDRRRKLQRKAKWPVKMSMKLSTIKGKGQSVKSAKDCIEESLTVAAAVAWHVENLLAEEGRRKALLASSKLGDLTSGLRILVQMILQEHSKFSHCMAVPPIRAYICLVTHIALRQRSSKEAKTSSRNKDKDICSTSGYSSGKNGIDSVLQEYLSWAEKLFIIHDRDETLKDAASAFQSKRKHAQVQRRKSSRKEALSDISNAADAGTAGKTDSCNVIMTSLVARISATILKSIVDIIDLHLVVQVPVHANCLQFASAFFQYIKLQIEKMSEDQKSTGNDLKDVLMCVKSSGTYAAKLIYLCLKSSNELAPEASVLANNLLDLITLSESSFGTRFAVSIQAVLKPWMPDLLIAVSSSANGLCSDGSLESERSKKGFNELAEEGKQLHGDWISTLANVELCHVNVINTQECRQPEADLIGETSIENEEIQIKEKQYHAALDFMKTVIKLLQKGDARVLHAIIKLIVSQAAFCLKNKDYCRVLGLLHFSCAKLLGCEKAQESCLNIVLDEYLLHSFEEISIHIEEALDSLQREQNGEQMLNISKGLVENVLSHYRS